MKNGIAKQSAETKSEGKVMKKSGSKVKAKGGTNGSGNEITDASDGKMPLIVIN